MVNEIRRPVTIRCTSLSSRGEICLQKLIRFAAKSKRKLAQALDRYISLLALYASQVVSMYPYKLSHLVLA